MRLDWEIPGFEWDVCSLSKKAKRVMLIMPRIIARISHHHHQEIGGEG
jgi:hypothetical protein